MQQSSCYFNDQCVGAEISGSVQIKSGDEYSLMVAVANAGPVSVGVDASSKAFRVYIIVKTKLLLFATSLNWVANIYI